MTAPGLNLIAKELKDQIPALPVAEVIAVLERRHHAPGTLYLPSRVAKETGCPVHAVVRVMALLADEPYHLLDKKFEFLYPSGETLELGEEEVEKALKRNEFVIPGTRTKVKDFQNLIIMSFLSTSHFVECLHTKSRGRTK